MRIVIDLQACQTTGSRHRGIGRYSLSLVKAMLRQTTQHEFYILLSGLFPDTIEYLRAEFSEYLPVERIVVWHAPKNVAENFESNQWRCKTAQIAREQMLHNLRPDLVHVTSLFEGSGDDAVTSVGVLPSNFITAVTLYDLIPYVYASKYLQDESQKGWYFRKLHHLKRADLLLAISEASRVEGINYLLFPEEKVVNISSAVDEQFQIISMSERDNQALRVRYQLHRPFVMYTGGIDLRKNIDALIHAFAALPQSIQTQYQLAIVCSVHQSERDRLCKLAKKLGMKDDAMVLTGFVPDADLPLLYQICHLFVFPSWHEGFGLPALEAMACGAAVIAANTSSLPEVIGLQEALFDPHSVEDISNKILEVLGNDVLLKRLKQHGIEQAKKFSWDASAAIAIAAFEQKLDEKIKGAKLNSTCNHQYLKPKLAFVTPLPPIESGIAIYNVDLILALEKFYEITIITDQVQVIEPGLSANFPIKDSVWFELNAFHFERIMYHFGNSPAHAYMYDLFEQFPGLVVLHDFYLGDSLAYLEMNQIKPSIWSNALYQSHGYASLLKTKDPTQHRHLIHHYPVSSGLLRNAHGIISHSQFSLQLAAQWMQSEIVIDWKVIPHLRNLPMQIEASKVNEIKKLLGWKDSDFLICSFGLLGESKSNQDVLDAFLSSNLIQNTNCHLVFVGKNEVNDYGVKLEKSIVESGYSDRIHITGFVDNGVYEQYLQIADMAVQLRKHTRGESSGSVLDCLAYGVPVIVNDIGAMSEIPKNIVVSLDKTFTNENLKQTIETLSLDNKLRQELSRLSKQYIEEERSVNKISQQYNDAIEYFYQNNLGSRLRQSVSAIANVEAKPESQDDVIELMRCLSLNSRVLTQKTLWVNVSAWQTHDELSSEYKEKIFSLLSLETTFRIELIQIRNSQFHYARKWVEKALDLSFNLNDDLVEFTSGDYYLELRNSKNTPNLTLAQEDSVSHSQKLHIVGVLNIEEEIYRNNFYISQVERKELEDCLNKIRT